MENNEVNNRNYEVRAMEVDGLGGSRKFIVDTVCPLGAIELVRRALKIRADKDNNRILSLGEIVGQVEAAQDIVDELSDENTLYVVDGESEHNCARGCPYSELGYANCSRCEKVIADRVMEICDVNVKEDGMDSVADFGNTHGCEGACPFEFADVSSELCQDYCERGRWFYGPQRKMINNLAFGLRNDNFLSVDYSEIVRLGDWDDTECMYGLPQPGFMSWDHKNKTLHLDVKDIQIEELDVLVKQVLRNIAGGSKGAVEVGIEYSDGYSTLVKFDNMAVSFDSKYSLPIFETLKAFGNKFYWGDDEKGSIAVARRAVEEIDQEIDKVYE